MKALTTWCKNNRLPTHMGYLTFALLAGFVIYAVRALSSIKQNQTTIMATQQEAAQQLTEVTQKLEKVSAETRGLVDEVAKLKTAAANAGEVGPELQAAIDAVTQKAAAVDELVPDAPAAPAGEEEAAGS